MTASTAPAATLSARLKAETQDQHTAAEKHPFHAMLFRGLLPLHVLLQHHSEMGLIQAALEDRLASTDAPEIRAVLQPHHRRASLFASDLVASGMMPPKQPSTQAAKRFISEIQAADSATLLGVFYVLEGSTNGGRFIQAAIMKAYGPANPGLTVTALSPHGDHQMARWGAFRTGLDSVELEPAKADRVVAGAARTFVAVTEVMEQIMPKGLVTPAAPAH
jgi:heme oxygenase